jgi:hypothetical protein
MHSIRPSKAVLTAGLFLRFSGTLSYSVGYFYHSLQSGSIETFWHLPIWVAAIMTSSNYPEYQFLHYQYADEVRGAIEIDKNDNVYIASTTRSADFPITSGAYRLR